MYKTYPELESAYRHIAELERLESEHSSLVASLKERRIKETLQYRIDSTSRVISFIKDEYNEGRLPNLDTLLTHCLNKLNGNIDGVELDLSTIERIEFITRDK